MSAPGHASPLHAFFAPATRRASFTIDHPVAPQLDVVAPLLAGAAEADITPPPGMPKAGYSSNAHDGAGFRTRLRARVLHLRAGTTSLALVQLDLLGGSAVVQHLVARAIREATDVPLEGLFIGATHTHAGPGQFLGTDFYNRFASNRTGFDPRWTQFLVDQISGAVVEAVATRRPARVAIGSTEVWGLTRNRSLRPHVHNAEVFDDRTEPQRKFVHVNPHLHLVRVDAAPLGADASGSREVPPREHTPGEFTPEVTAGEPTPGEPRGAGTAEDRSEGAAFVPMGAMVVFSVHGTGIPMRAHEYNADLWAYLVGELRHRIEQRHGVPTVAGAVEGTHADIAPALRPGMAGHVEAARVGRSIGAQAAALHERLGTELSDEVVLGAGLREVDLSSERSIGGVTLPKRPAVGAALIAGAHENVTPVVHRIPPFRPGSPKPWRTRHPQGAKWVLGSRWFQPLVLPLRGFPRVLPVQVLRLGSTLLVGLPFEVTVASGRRIEAAVSEALSGSWRVVVSSVANEYSGYVATEEEYAMQHYEGGHTLYGPATQPFVAAHAARLAREVVSGVPRSGAGEPLRGASDAPRSGADGGSQRNVRDVLAERSFDLKVRHFLPAPGGDAVVDAGSVPREALVAARFFDASAREDPHWEFVWRDVAPAQLRWHEPMAHVEACDGDPEDPAAWVPARAADGRLVNDQGWDLEIEHLGAAKGGNGHAYAVRWHDPSFRFGRLHRFVLCANADRPEFCSAPFD